jgi:hypothetical protein
MKKGKILVLALVVFLMVFGLVLIGCEEKSRDPNCDKKGLCYFNFTTGQYLWCSDERCAAKASQTATRCDC